MLILLKKKSLYAYESFNVQSTISTCSLSVLVSYACVVHTSIVDSIITLTLIRIKLKIEDNSVKLDDSPRSFQN